MAATASAPALGLVDAPDASSAPAVAVVAEPDANGNGNGNGHDNGNGNGNGNGHDSGGDDGGYGPGKPEDASRNACGCSHRDTPLALVQGRALCLKNIRILYRRWRATLLLLLLPAAAISILWGVTTAFTADTPAVFDFTPQPCKSFDANGDVVDTDKQGLAPCIPVLYAPSGGVAGAQYDSIMTFFRAQTGLNAQGVADWNTLSLWLWEHPGAADYAVLFGGGVYNVSYTLWRNATNAANYASLPNDNAMQNYYSVDGRSLSLSVALEGAIMAYMANSTGTANPHVPLSTPNSKIDFKPFSELGGLQVGNPESPVVLFAALPLIVCGASMVMIGAMNYVVYEKQHKLLGAMRMMGLRESAYWASWYLCFVPLFVAGILLALVLAYASGMRAFVHTDFGIHFVSMLLFTLSWTAMGFMFASFLTRPRWVNIISFLLLFFAILTGFLLIAIYGPTYVGFIYDPGNQNILAGFCFLFPFVHYGKFFSDVLRVTSTQPNSNSAQAVLSNSTAPANDHFGWSQLYEHQLLPPGCDPTATFGSNTCWTVPNPSYELQLMVANTVIYLFLAWYLGQVFSGSASQKWYFLVSPRYWGCAARTTYVEGDTLAKEQSLSLRDQTIRIHKLSKSYDKVTAVKEMSLHMNRGEVLALLGHNGAGKTSVIHVLTGLYNPTHGDAFIFGLSVRDDMAAIQTRMGICPQENVLWEFLTAREHLELYSSFKNVDPAAMARDVDDCLRSVKLLGVPGPAGSFSGGMKRRLHCAMAFVGHPAVIFCDEPTTGMDPLHRRVVWQAIADRKRHAIVVLTTHSMEEADMLGDQIAIMSGGRLRAKGTSLFLKHHFGAGYQINLLAASAQPAAIEELTRLVGVQLPGSEVLNVSAGSMTIALPRKAVQNIPSFFRWLDRSTEHVKEWGISDSTLEEVFLRLASQSKEVNEVAVDQRDNQTDVKLCVTCKVNAAERVTLYTKRGTAVHVENVLCVHCANDEQQAVDQIGGAGSAGARAAAGDAKDNQPLLIADDAPVAGAADGDVKGAPAASPVAAAADAASPPSPAQDAAPSSGKHVAPLVNMGTPAAVSPGAAAAGGAHGAAVAIHMSMMSGDKQQPAAKDMSAHFTQNVGASVQLRAVLLKEFAILTKQRKQNVCQIIILLVTLLLGAYLAPRPSAHEFVCDAGYLPDAQAPKGTPNSVLCNATYYQQQMNFSLTQTQNGYSLFPYPNPIYCPGWPYGACVYKQTLNYQLLWATWSSSLPMRVWYVDSPVPGDVSMGALDVFGIGVPGYTSMSMSSTTWAGANWTAARGPDVNRLVFEAQQFIQANQVPLAGLCQTDQWIGDTGYYAGTYAQGQSALNTMFPDLGLTFRRANLDELRVEYTANRFLKTNQQTNTAQKYNWQANPFRWLYTAIVSSDQNDNSCSETLVQGNTVYGDNLPFAGFEVMTNMVHNALIWTKLGPDANITSRFLDMPQLTYPVFHVGRGVTVVIQSLFLVLTLLFLPQFIQTLVAEREDKLFHMMRISGLKTAAYFGGLYVFNFALFGAWSLLWLLMGYALGGAYFTSGNVGLYFVASTLLWNHAQIGVAFFVAALFSSKRFASLVGYALLILTVVAGAGLVLAIKGSWNSALFLAPPLAYARALSLIMTDVTGSGSAELTTAFVFLFVFGSVFLVVGVYLNICYYRPPWFFLDWCRTLAHEKPLIGGAAGEDLSQKLVPHSTYGGVGDRDDAKLVAGAGGAANDAAALAAAAEREAVLAEDAAEERLEDEDVRRERARVEADERAHAMAIRIKNLCKTYAGAAGAPPNRAVKRLSMAVDFGEVLGFLGTNGAGKTTTLDILCGYQSLTSGSAHIAGHDVVTQLDAIYRVLGVCPQFDTVWEDLTVRDHLLCYARLKGVARHAENAVIQQIAESVELDGDAFNMASSALSGGMKRRLSIGISLLGGPRVWLLDEPTTGLDPETRRQVWTILNRQKTPERAIVITTHSMEEADTLCTRIAIMKRGRMRAVGTQLHLKNRFGEGYKLTLHLGDSKHFAEADNLIRTRVCAQAPPPTQQGTNRVYVLPVQKLDIAACFNLMAAHKQKLDIKEWGIQQSSLEDVFVRLARDKDEDDPTLNVVV